MLYSKGIGVLPFLLPCLIVCCSAGLSTDNTSVPKVGYSYEKPEKTLPTPLNDSNSTKVEETELDREYLPPVKDYSTEETEKKDSGEEKDGGTEEPQQPAEMTLNDIKQKRNVRFGQNFVLPPKRSQRNVNKK